MVPSKSSGRCSMENEASIYLVEDFAYFESKVQDLHLTFKCTTPVHLNDMPS